MPDKPDMRILYDGEIYKFQKVGGINRYFDNIISRLPADFQPVLMTVRARSEHQLSHPNLRLLSCKKSRFERRKIERLLDSYYFRLIEAVNSFEVFHPTYYSLLTRRNLKKKTYPIVLTVYDMIHEIYGDLIDYDGHIAQQKRQAILAADVILCISESTKKDLLERYRLSEKSVWVTHLATEFNLNSIDENAPVPLRPFYLFVGVRNGYKNFDSLLFALSRTISKYPEIVLCVVGSPFNRIEQTKIAEMKLENHIEHFGYANDAHLAKLYQSCVAFVYPSFYEGFGLPPLEAMACRAPVIASYASSIPEVVGDAGLLFNPNSIQDLTDRLLFLIENPSEREILIARGLEQAEKFSWDKTAAQTVEAYRYVAG
jgi:glycosyltransferase involved in cell wall biosynthesis